MKISIASDVHLEFGDLEITNTDQADVLVLSGDILVGVDITQRDPHGIMGPEYRSNRYHDFMQRCAAQFGHVIYVMGNHEHYNGDFAHTHQHLKSVLSYLDNVSILERECRVLDDVTFIGGTLWTDMNGGDALTLQHMSKMMNDFVCVKNSNRMVSYRTYDNIDKPVGMTDSEWLERPETDRYRTVFRTRPAKFTPDDAMLEHQHMLEYIRLMTEGHWDRKFVVVGHHAPSRQSTHPRYAHDTIMNGGYSSNLDQFIEDHPQIRLWTHGHTHEDFDYMIGQTRVVCNPRGYAGHETRTQEWKLKTVTV
jgi:Icc-related predicted phosphoesterase